jgi:hypothetical protein
MQRILLLYFLSFLVYAASWAAEPVVVGNLHHQLGNQFFIIAATASLAWDNGATPVFPNLVKQRKYNTITNYRNIFYRLNVTVPPGTQLGFHYFEPHYHYAPIPYEPNMQISGYFQSEKYFAHHKEEIKELFSPSEEIQRFLKENYQDILDHPNTVAIYVRSFLEEDPKQTCFITYGRDYYKKAMEFFSGEDVLFVVFSNKMNWCKKLLKGLPGKIRFIEGEKYYHDFYLMSRCKHHIICNSTFSWWAAYLNPNQGKKVITPKIWFNPNFEADTKDLLPSEWISLD